MTEAGETEWTQGPWSVDRSRHSWRSNSIGRIRIVAGPQQSWGVATIHALLHQEANAQLISAAPDLFDALAAIIEGGESDLTKARAALAKARGLALTPSSRNPMEE